MERVPAEIPEEIGMLLQHHDGDPGAREQQPQHHTGRATAGSADDTTQTGVPLGFSFEFYGNTYTTVTLADNGLLGFGTIAGSDWSNDPIPSTFTPNDFVAPYWGDLNTSIIPGSIRYLTSGPIGDQVFTVQWQSVAQYGGSPTGSRMDATWAVRLYEATGEVHIYYGGMLNIGFAANGNIASIGIENSTGLSGMTVGRNAAGTVLSGSHFAFYPF